MYRKADVPTTASSVVVIQRKACVTRTVVRSNQIVAQVLTVVVSSLTFVNV